MALRAPVYHPDPDDHWRSTCAGLQRVAADAGLEVEPFGRITGVGATGLQLFQDSACWWLSRLVRDVFALICHAGVALTDRFENPGRPCQNALVLR